LTFLFTTRGIPMMYYGTELLMTGYEHHGHGGIRERFPGGWPGDTKSAFSARGRTDKQNEVVNHIRTLLEFRRLQPALHYGWLKHFVPSDNIYVYFRYDDKSTVMVVINSNAQSKTLDTKRFSEATSGFSLASDILSGKSFDVDAVWRIPAKTALVLELR